VRIKVITAAALALTLLPAAAAEGRTTDLFAFANKEDRPAGYLLRGDKIHVIAHRFIPKALCKPKVHFTLTDSAGTKFKVGSAHPSFGDFGEGAMNRNLEEVPAAAKPGKATIRSKQKCRLGTASGKDGIRIIDPGQPRPKVTRTGALDVMSGNKTTLAFQVDRYAYANVVVEWELVPGEWRLIDNVAPREFLPKADTYSLDWRAKAGGNVPAGHYRFRITPRAPGVGNGESVAELFGIQTGRAKLFDGAAGISADPAGRLLVADPPRNSVGVLDFGGKTVDGFGGGALAQPLDVAAQGGDAYIADTGNRRLARRPPGGNPVPFAGSAGTGPGQFSPSKGPQSVAATGQNGGRVYAVDGAIPRIQGFDFTGTLQQTITGGGLATPQGVAAGPDGSVWVADPAARSLLRFSGAGAPLASLETGSPVAVDTDRSGRVVAADGSHGGEFVVLDPAAPGGLRRFGARLVGNPTQVALAGMAGDVFAPFGGRLLHFRVP
jgi:hypothetical protein